MQRYDFSNDIANDNANFFVGLLQNLNFALHFHSNAFLYVGKIVPLYVEK